MHHRITCMYFNFQQYRVIRVSRSVKTFRTNIFVKKCKLQKFETTNSIFFNQLLRTCIIIERTCIQIFSNIGFVDQSKPFTQIYLQKNCKLHTFAATNSIF